MASNTDLFSPDKILKLAGNALRRDDGEQSSLKNPYEAVALIGHACMVAIGFRLVGLGEDHVIAKSSEETSSLPEEWNSNDSYAFRYAHSQSSMQYLLKTSRIGNNALAFAIALGDDRTTSFDIPLKDYISNSSLPITSSTDLDSTLGDVFISRGRLGDLIGLFKINVIQKLAPGLDKEGYEDNGPTLRERQQEAPPRHDPLRDDTQPPPARPYPFDDPLAAGPRRPAPPGDFAPPGFEDEFEIHRPPRGWAPGMGGGGALGGYGNRDLYPPGLGPNDPLRGGGVGPGLGGGGGGGMHPTFDDMFGGRHNGGYDPQAPPGARYDPVGPGGPPFGSGGRGPFGRGAGGGFGGFGGDII